MAGEVSHIVRIVSYLPGTPLEGIPIEGCDTVLLLGACGLGFELAFLLPPLMAWRARSRRARGRR